MDGLAMITIKLFASLREKVGESSIDYSLNKETNIEGLMSALSQRSPQWQALAEEDVLVAINQTLSAKSATIKDGDEIAFFPPVTGG